MLSTKSGAPKWGPYLCFWVLMMGCICATGEKCYHPGQRSVFVCDGLYQCSNNGTENAFCTPDSRRPHPKEKCYSVVPSKIFDCEKEHFWSKAPHCCFNGTSDAKCCQYEPGPNHETCYEKYDIDEKITIKKFTCPYYDNSPDSWTACCNNNTYGASCCGRPTTTTKITWPTFVTPNWPTPNWPSTERSTTERPTTERPTTVRPTTEGPTTERPTTERPTTERPTTEGPTTEVPTTEGPTTDIPWPTFEPDYHYSYTAMIAASVGSLCGFIIVWVAVGIYIRRRRAIKRRTAVVFPQQPAVTTTQTGNSAQTGNLAKAGNSSQTSYPIPYQQPGLYPPPNYVYPNQLPPMYSGQAYPYPPPPPGSVYTILVQNQTPPAYAPQDPAGSQAAIGLGNATQDPNSQTGIGFDNRSFVPTSPLSPSATSTTQNP